MIGRLKHAVDRRVGAVIERLDSLAGRMEALEVQVERLRVATGELARQPPEPRAGAGGEELRKVLEERIEPLLRAVVDDDAGNRRRLHALRGTPEYAAPFDEPDPLVSVTLPTRNRPEPLARALRSLLEQTHEHLEVLVVGDAAGPEIAEAVACAGDPRVHYANLTQRIVAHPDPHRHWLVASTMARNEAARRARGAWLLHFDDDDTLRPDAVGSLLARAREERAEVSYGGFITQRPDGGGTVQLPRPPAECAVAWQGALVHRGLGYFERELVAADLGLPGDAYLMRRMLRAGVRFALLDRVIWDYFPAGWWLQSSAAVTTSQTSSTAAGSSSP
jgi:Glycosyl transferase family 2